MNIFQFDNGIIKKADDKFSKNWGDNISYDIVKFFSKSEKLNVVNQNSTNNRMFVVGSVLQYVRNNDIIWGAGVLSNKSRHKFIKDKSNQYYSVRGPLSRDVLSSYGIYVPKVYGDPALLFPEIYNPILQKKYKISIIPHYSEHAYIKQLNLNNINIIDICQDIYSFLDEVISSEIIISSSLHGLIAADAYNIPNTWLKFKSHIWGDFKYIDYFRSVRRKEKWININDITKSNIDLNRSIDINLNNLKENAPWNDKTLQNIFY